jgi:hypothetical protein
MTKREYRQFFARMAEKFGDKALNAADGKNPEAARAYFSLSLRAAQESLTKRG